MQISESTVSSMVPTEDGDGAFAPEQAAEESSHIFSRVTVGTHAPGCGVCVSTVVRFVGGTNSEVWFHSARLQKNDGDGCLDLFHILNGGG